MAVTWVQADADALRTVIASGAMTVTYSGPPSRSVTYHSLPEMRALLAEMVAEIARTAGTRVTVRYPTVRKGFFPDD